MRDDPSLFAAFSGGMDTGSHVGTLTAERTTRVLRTAASLAAISHGPPASAGGSRLLCVRLGPPAGAGGRI
jgi:hypothetical protein